MGGLNFLIYLPLFSEQKTFRNPTSNTTEEMSKKSRQVYAPCEHQQGTIEDLVKGYRAPQQENMDSFRQFISSPDSVTGRECEGVYGPFGAANSERGCCGGSAG